MTPAILTVWSVGFPGSTASGFLVAAPKTELNFSLVPSFRLHVRQVCFAKQAVYIQGSYFISG